MPGKDLNFQDPKVPVDVIANRALRNPVTDVMQW